MNVFSAADILMPQVDDLSTWAVIACDQFTSDQSYWEQVRAITQGVPSAFHLILPEVELGTAQEQAHTQAAHDAMRAYCADGVFRVYPNSYVYVERTLKSGAVRKGLVGMVDLEAYDFHPGSASAIRATEQTVAERIPPRQRVRRGASIELPHVLLLCDDNEHKLLSPICAKKAQLPCLYDFELMLGGGHLTGWLVAGQMAEVFDRVLADYCAHVPEKYKDLPNTPMVFAVGDGNHSLATAKSCYEELKAAHPGEDLSHHPARYALVELENIHDEALVFEPIHRIVHCDDPMALLRALQSDICAADGFPVRWHTQEQAGTIYLNPAKGELAVGILQSFLDKFLRQQPGKIDYIHDDDALLQLSAQPGAIGFLLPAMEKRQLFRGVISDGILPRKTFSMGQSREKRYYLEGRFIQK